MALRPQLREGGLWLGSRATNGVLGLAQVSLTAAAIGPHEAGRFFLLWTGSWLLATVLKFGTDGILPRVVAEAHLAGRDVPSLLRPLAAGAAAFALLLVPLLAVFRVPIGGASIAVTVGIALCWAATFILAGALKADGQVAVRRDRRHADAPDRRLARAAQHSRDAAIALAWLRVRCPGDASARRRHRRRREGRAPPLRFGIRGSVDCARADRRHPSARRGRRARGRGASRRAPDLARFAARQRRRDRRPCDRNLARASQPRDRGGHRGRDRLRADEPAQARSWMASAPAPP